KTSCSASARRSRPMSDLGRSVTLVGHRQPLSRGHRPCFTGRRRDGSRWAHRIGGAVLRDSPSPNEGRHDMPTPADREKALETALAQIDRQFGKGTVMRLGSDERAPVAVIPTGSIALDVALGIGGLPRGRIIEIYGPESSGKTTLTLHAIANAQRNGGIAAFIDAEHALDPEYAKKLGVDID